MLPSQPNEILDPIVLHCSTGELASSGTWQDDLVTLWTPALPRCSWLQGSLSCWEYLRQDLLPSRTVKTLWHHYEHMPVTASAASCVSLPTSAISRSSFILSTSGHPNTRISSLASITSWHTTHTDASTGWLGTIGKLATSNRVEHLWKKKQNHLYPRIRIRPNLALDLFISLFFAVSVDCDVGVWSNTNTLLRGANKINWVGYIPKNTYTRHRTIMIVSKNGFVWEWLTH